MWSTMKWLFIYIPCLLGTSVATVIIDPVGDITAVEGNNLTISCTGGANQGATLILRENGIQLVQDAQPPAETNDATRIFHLPVDRTRNGNTYDCESGITGMVSSTLTLSVTYRPQFSLTTVTATPTEGGQLMVSFSLDANPPSTIDNITFNGTLVNDTRFTVTATSLTIADVTRNDSGVYQITGSNVAGSDTFTLTVDVYYPPELIVPSQNVTRNAVRNESFTFDCTPSGGNPAVYSYTFQKGSVVVTEGVSGSVLTINPVVRGDEGTYTCEANNTVGIATVTWNLFVVDVPTMPLNPRVMDLMPFSANLQWGSPSDDGGSSLPLTYTVTLNGTTFSDLMATSHPLTNLQHSTQYSWSVQAMNEYGTGPPAVDTFRTPDSVPIIQSVSAMALSLSLFQVDITLFTDGGQSVTMYTIEIRGVNYTGVVESSVQNQVSVQVSQLEQNFTKGENHTVMVFATNSVGTSSPQSTELIVPLPPSVTAPPSELSSTDNIPVCCAGVQLNLENPNNPIDVRVLFNDTTLDLVVRNGSILYIMGLQAGTEYFLNITLSNVFGTVWFNTTVSPLLGRPSTPQVTLTPTAGSLRVQLTTMYPGTRESTLQYSISTSTSPRSRRQTGQQTLPVTDLTTTVSGSEEVALDPGNYSVTVTVTNQHGNTTSVPQEVTIPAPPPALTPATDNTGLIIGVVVAVVILVLLLILVVFVIVLFYMKRRDTKGQYKMEKKEPVNGDEDLEMMGTRSEDPLAPQYEDPDTLSRKPPPAVTYKKAEEAVDTQPNPSGVVYASLDFSKQQLGKKKTLLEKKKEPPEVTIYSEICQFTQLDEQQLKNQEAEDGERSHSPTTIM